MILESNLIVIIIALLWVYILVSQVYFMEQLRKINEKISLFLHNDYDNVPSSLNLEEKESDESLIIIGDKEKTTIKPSQLFYIKAEAGGVNYYTNQGVFFVWQSLKACREGLPEEKFVQVNRSTVIALHAIIERADSILVMCDGHRISVSPAYQHQLVVVLE